MIPGLQLALYVGVIIPFLFLIISLKGEPRRQNMALLWGFLSAIMAYYLNTGMGILLNISEQGNKNDMTGIIAPVAEELLKSLPLFFLIARKENFYKNSVPGYAMASGIGFSIFENFNYVLNLEFDTTFLLIIFIFIRSISTALMHGVSTTMIGMGITYFKRGGKYSNFLNFGMLLSAVIIHSFFNMAMTVPILNIFGLIFPWLIFLFQYFFLQLFKGKRINFNFFSQKN